MKGWRSSDRLRWSLGVEKRLLKTTLNTSEKRKMRKREDETRKAKEQDEKGKKNGSQE